MTFAHLATLPTAIKKEPKIPKNQKSKVEIPELKEFNITTNAIRIKPEIVENLPHFSNFKRC